MWLLRDENMCTGNVWTGPYKFEDASQYFLLIFQICVSDVPPMHTVVGFNLNILVDFPYQGFVPTPNSCGEITFFVIHNLP